MNRERSVTWDDPTALADVARRSSGLEFLQGVARGELAQFPIASVLGFQLVEASHGEVVFTTQIDEVHFNNIGSVHGGFPAALIDSASGCAVFSTLAKGDAWTTLNLDVDYLRPLPVGDAARCVGRVVRVGRRVGVADAELFDSAGRICARGSSRCLITRGAPELAR